LVLASSFVFQVPEVFDCFAKYSTPVAFHIH